VLFCDDLDVNIKGDESNFNTFKISKMRFSRIAAKKTDKTTIKYNDNIIVKNITEKVYDYQVENHRLNGLLTNIKLRKTRKVV